MSFIQFPHQSIVTQCVSFFVQCASVNFQNYPWNKAATLTGTVLRKMLDLELILSWGGARWTLHGVCVWLLGEMAWDGVAAGKEGEVPGDQQAFWDAHDFVELALHVVIRETRLKMWNDWNWCWCLLIVFLPGFPCFSLVNCFPPHVC